MKQLFSTKLKIILVLTALVTAALSVVAGLTNRSLPDVLVQGLMTPFRSAATTLTNTVEKYYSYMFRYEALEAENQVLKKQLSEMQDTARQADATTRENERLRKLNQLETTHESYVMLDAYIIGWSSTAFTNVLTINKGSNSGITTNMCAVTANGEVVGLVTQVGPNYAEVKTVLDSTLEVSSTISDSGYNGMVKGGYIDGNEKFLKGIVVEGIVRPDIVDEFKCCNVYAKEKCRSCFAKFYCSGGCAANSYNCHGKIDDVYELGCELQKKRVECAIMIKAALADEEE